MTQGTKIAVGVAVVGVAGFFYIENRKKNTNKKIAEENERQVLAQQQVIIGNPKIDDRFIPVDLKPLELKPIKQPITEDAIFRKFLVDIFPVNKPIVTQTTSLPKTIAPSLNRNLVLKFGSKGLEVRELQPLLGFTGKNIDGIFGKNTLLALQKKKRVSTITLNKF